MLYFCLIELVIDAHKGGMEKWLRWRGWPVTEQHEGQGKLRCRGVASTGWLGSAESLEGSIKVLVMLIEVRASLF